MPYAAIHQFGGVIVPKNAKALRFKLPSGQWVTVKKVVIPPRPFFPVDSSGKLTPKAEQLIARAGEREMLRRVGVK
jgi:phage gpG-like protein